MKAQEEQQKKKKKKKKEQEQEEQDGSSEHLPRQCLPPSSITSVPKQEQRSQVDLELKLLEALQFYPPSKLKGVHRHLVLYGLMEYLEKRFGRHFSSHEILQLLDRFFDLEMIKSDDEDVVLFNQEDGFSLPQSFLVKEGQ